MISNLLQKELEVIAGGFNQTEITEIKKICNEECKDKAKEPKDMNPAEMVWRGAQALTVLSYLGYCIYKVVTFTATKLKID